MRALQARGTGIETPILHFLYLMIRVVMLCFEITFTSDSAAGVVVTYQVPNLVPRVRFPGGAFFNLNLLLPILCWQSHHD